METLLFGVGIFVFMITVYGTVMAGGSALKRKQVDELADDTELVVDENGYEVFAGNKSAPSDDDR